MWHRLVRARSILLAAGLMSGLVLLGPSPDARAEGATEAGVNQGLRRNTKLRVDIFNTTTETFVWDGDGTVDVFAPDNQMLGTYSALQVITPLSGITGAYLVQLDTDQFQVDLGQIVSFTNWDLTVYVGATPHPGRVWSDHWWFDAGGFDQPTETNASFFGLVPGGLPDDYGVIELNLSGMAGFVYIVSGTRTGYDADGVNPGMSVYVGTTLWPHRDYAIYLNEPEKANHVVTPPTVSDFEFNGGPTGCNLLVGGESAGAFTFDTNVEGTYHILCDLDNDGVLSITDASDLHLAGVASTISASNVVVWDGLDVGGDVVLPGVYPCELRIMVGEFHFLANDVETSYPGLRLFAVDGGGGRSSLDMVWNDELVQSNVGTMPNDDISAETSGATGLSSAYGDTIAPHGQLHAGNARAWGRFESFLPNKGDMAILDTYVWLDSVSSSLIDVQVIDGTLDTDSDGLTDYVERCVLGSVETETDTDGDGVSDYDETDAGAPLDTDGDGINDVLDEDDDDDTVPTADEDRDGNGDPTDDDSDGDGIPDYLDADDQDGPLGDPDGDGVATQDDNCPDTPNPDQTDVDANGVGDACQDSDGDGVMALDDCDDHDNTVSVVQTYYRDEDSDGFGDPGGINAVCDVEPPEGYIVDGTDNCPAVANPEQEDTDGDGVGNACQESPGSSCGCAATGNPSSLLFGLLLIGLFLVSGRRRKSSEPGRPSCRAARR
jgi:MYXO-CTERM domain-containing protein